MGVPDRPSQGKHGSAGRAGGQGSQGTECLPLKDISQPSGTAPPLPLSQDGGGEGGARREVGLVFLREISISIRPHTPIPNAFPSAVDLSAAVFLDEPFEKPKPSKKKPET